MRNSTENADKKCIRQQAKMIKPRINAGTCGSKKGKSNSTKRDHTTRGNKSEGNGERNNKAVQTKQNIPKQRKRFLAASRGRLHENIPTMR